MCSKCADITNLAVRPNDEIGPCDCKDHFVWDDEEQTCVFDGDCPVGKFGTSCDQDCFPSCETCTAEHEDMCQTCPENSYRSVETAATSKCSAEPWYGWNSARSAFIACPGFCRKCTDGRCETCVDGAEKDDSTGLCKCYPDYTAEEEKYCKEPETGTDCALGTFPSTNGGCEKCSSNCNICSSATACTTCRPPYVMETTTTAGVIASSCSCLSTDVANYYENTTTAECIKCHNTCEACYGSKADQCLKCIGLAHWFNTK